jgi:hypothetical protein
MIGVLALLLVGFAIAAFAVFALFRMPNRDTGNFQVAEIQLADLIELRALKFKNFPRLFSDSDCRVLRVEPRLVRIARGLRMERRRLALRWLASVRSDVLSLWLLRRLLIAYGVSLGPVSELAMTCRVIFVLIAISALQCSVFVFGPFAFQRIVSRSRKYIEAYSRSCQVALRRLPKSKVKDFEAAWRYHRAAA